MSCKELLDDFIENPSIEALGALSRHTGHAHDGCFAWRVYGSWPSVPADNALEKQLPCNDCPLSKANFPISFCTYIHDPRLSPESALYVDVHFGDVVLALVKFRSWIELLKEEKRL